jgi:hypothetical protein
MTVTELKRYLLERGLRPNAVSFEGGLLTAAEQHVIEQKAGLWEVYYYERGNRNNLILFPDESSACSYLLSILEKDRTVWQRGSL